MKTKTAGLVILGVFIASGAQAQVIELTQTNQPSISVVGNGEASRPADYGTLRFFYRGEGKTQVDALRALTLLRARVEGGLNSLKGLSGIKIEPSTFNVLEVWAKGCDPAEGPVSIGEYSPGNQVPRSGCTVESYIATSRVSAEISPAEISGNATSLAAQLGAVNVSLEGGGVRDPAALDQSAAKAALANAQAKAEAIAAASGLRLGPILRIQDQRFGAGAVYKEYSDQAVRVGLVRAAALLSPTVGLDLPPPPIKREAQMSVLYSIER